MKPQLRTIILFALVPMLILVTALQAWRVHHSIYNVIIEGFDRKLMAVGQATALRLDGDRHEEMQKLPPEASLEEEDFSQYFDPEDPYFVAHREALRELRRATGLTYLYTQVHLGVDKIFYLLDGTDGDDWAPPGTGDVIPDDSLIGIRDVQAFGIPWVTDLLEWDVWGLIKAAYIPIYNSRGEVVAMVGADVDSTIIRTKTRQALFMVLFIGALTIAISLMVAFRIAGALTRPIDQIRNAALSIAAGDPPTEPLRAHLREINQLATTLDRLNQRLDTQQREALALEGRLQEARKNEPVSAEADASDATAPDPESDSNSGSTPLQRIFFLNSLPPFNTLPATDLLILAKSCKDRSYAPDKILCPAGYVPEYLFLIRSGSVVTPGGGHFEQIAGIDSVTSGEPLSEDLRAGPEGCEAIVLARGKLLTLLHDRPDLLPTLLGQPVVHAS